ncbi:choice-of-anchor Q domain-containing protein [Flammeovirga sp. EKP202]|uniref:choice-of-anchor Q domain-containing protein n=1 Tax=Flammeovirga sp. EKP202 TaxID=2770592 RepID=UPI00165FE009|nr:choice-of-anchor Q domain-containing protein [Flammeovirga sp. EKP202]MBD0400173.1 hypothetical protein [Flammeovirga sp. EKP202]
MKSIHLFFYIAIGVCFFVSCDPKDEILSSDPNIRLSFSQDTIFFDTLYTSKVDEGIDMPSITQRFKVYNSSENAVNIAEISLSDPDNVYQLLINGQASDKVENAFLRGGDSMLIFAEANIPHENNDEIREFIGSVNLFTNGNRQEVILSAFAEDPYYISGGEIINGNVIWSKGRPYVIVDSLFVSESSSLTVEAGSRLVFNNDAKIHISGSLKLQGTVEDTIRLESIRVDGRYFNSPGQWGGLIFDSLSNNNEVKGVHLKNATFGLYIYHPDEDDIIDLTVENSTIENISQVGINAIGADVSVVNSIISHTVSNAYSHSSGGKCNFIYNTVVNENTGFFREGPSVSFGTSEDETINTIDLTLKNSIIWGSLREEILILDGVNSISVMHNLLKSPREDFDQSNILNTDPFFKVPYSYNYQLSEESPARDAGVDVVGIETDQVGVSRNSPPDIGALQYVPDPTAVPVE